MEGSVEGKGELAIINLATQVWEGCTCASKLFLPQIPLHILVIHATTMLKIRILITQSNKHIPIWVPGVAGVEVSLLEICVFPTFGHQQVRVQLHFLSDSASQPVTVMAQVGLTLIL